MNGLAQQAHWLLRIALASVFIFHGYGKLFVTGVPGFASAMGLPELVAYLVVLAEFGGGILVLAGGVMNSMITRMGAFAMIPVMIGAIAKAHWGRWSFTPAEGFPMGGMEFQVVLILVALYLLIRGNSTASD